MSDTNGHRPLSAADIGSAEDLEVVEVVVPEWKGKVYLRDLPADEGIDMSAAMQALPENGKTAALFILLAACLCTEQGAPLFPGPAECRATLGKRKMAVLLRLQKEALKLQGMLDEDAAKNV